MAASRRWAGHEARRSRAAPGAIDAPPACSEGRERVRRSGATEAGAAGAAGAGADVASDGAGAGALAEAVTSIQKKPSVARRFLRPCGASWPTVSQSRPSGTTSLRARCHASQRSASVDLARLCGNPPIHVARASTTPAVAASAERPVAPREGAGVARTAPAWVRSRAPGARHARAQVRPSNSVSWSAFAAASASFRSERTRARPVDVRQLLQLDAPGRSRRLVRID